MLSLKVTTPKCHVCGLTSLAMDPSQINVLTTDGGNASKQGTMMFYQCNKCFKRHGKILRAWHKVNNPKLFLGYFKKLPFNPVTLPK